MRALHVAAAAVAIALLATCGGTDSKASNPTEVDGASAVSTASKVSAASTGPTTSAETSTSDAIAATETVVGSALDRGTEVDIPATDAISEEEFSGDAASPFCDLLRQLDGSNPLDSAFGNSTTPEATKASWDQVMAVFTPLKETAPDEIANDVAVATRFIDVMDRIFVDSKYDMVKIATALEADPELAGLGDGNPEMDAATARLDAYGVQVCGLAS